MANETSFADHLRTTHEPSLREIIMERRRNRYGAGPTKQSEVTYEQWRSQLKPITPAVWTPPEPRETPHLYFIGSDGGPIKIGVSVNPESRLKALQTSNPHRLRILAMVDRGGTSEAEYHARFAEHRLHGEWFHPHPDILAEIERLKELSA